MKRTLIALCVVLALQSTVHGGNLLRNGEFQDDWITMLPETKNHHWCFPSEFFNRRDYNPDGWYCKGSWDWQNADGPWDTRRMVITGPAELYQRVNWIAIHDDRKLAGFPDAGGFPVMVPAKSKSPEKLVRDLTFRVKLAGTDVPNNAGIIEAALHPPTALATHDPMGERNPASVASFVAIPAGTYAAKWIEVKVRAADWLEGFHAKKTGEVDLPALAAVLIRYTAKTGKLDIERAELLAAPSDAPNLLPNGTFESLDKAGYPTGWSRPIKYTYFPPRHYYIFNTWHNTSFPNRGSVEIDKLIPHAGKHSLRMIVPSGDETAVVSEPITLNQKMPNLIEVTAWIMTDRLCMLQIDGHDEKGNRLDGFNFIHKAPVSIGTDKWRMIRQVFRPRTPVGKLRLTLAARGVNGYTLDDTRTQPQNNVVGTIWWDDVKVSEPEASAKELQDRGVKPVAEAEVKSGPRIVELDLGERLHGANYAKALVNGLTPGKQYHLRFVLKTNVYGDPEKRPYVGPSQQMADAEGTAIFQMRYLFGEELGTAYSDVQGRLTLSEQQGVGMQDLPVASSDVRFGFWPAPLKIDLGALYLRPGQKQLVRVNFGLTRDTYPVLKSVRLEILRRSSGQVVKAIDVDATPKVLADQRTRIPLDLRDDFANLLLADVDLGVLPIQGFADPRRNWFIRASAIVKNGRVIATVDSQPFCVLAHDAPQPAIQNVTIKNGMTYINGQPWMPFGVCYGHTPVYDGPADPGAGKYRDLCNLPGWSMYDRHNSNSSSRKQYDFNCMRYVAGSITPFDTLNKKWTGDNLYCSSAFAIPTEAMSLDALFKKAGGQAKLDAYLAECGKSPMVVSIAPGIEEAFGLFQGATPAELKGLEHVVDHVRKKSGRPVMVGHGGYWNRLEFEKVPFFDIYDPETEPLYPANIHTDLAPLVKDKNKVIWLRPQMYESIPYERWRFHTYVEMMRGARGWQIAHGPGDASLFRGLHGEMEFWKPIVATMPATAGRGDGGEGGPPKVKIDDIEHKAWKYNGKTYLIAATTHGIPLGDWTADRGATTLDIYRTTFGKNELRDETNAYGIGAVPESGGAVHGVQYLPDAKIWPKGSKLTQRLVVDSKDPAKGLAIFVKADGRWTHVATWGKVDLAKLRSDTKTSYWFLNTFYRHAKGFLGWGTDLVPKSLEYIPDKAIDMGAVPLTPRPPEKEDTWQEIEVALDKIGATGKLLDGVAFMHDSGRITWGATRLHAPDGATRLIWQEFARPLRVDGIGSARIEVAGLKAGTKIRVVFEDREIIAKDGFFEDDFSGQDLYQRHGGSTGYGNTPVALHAYEIP